jgi:hypothetical protein
MYHPGQKSVKIKAFPLGPSRRAKNSNSSRLRSRFDCLQSHSTQETLPISSRVLETRFWKEMKDLQTMVLLSHKQAIASVVVAL